MTYDCRESEDDFGCSPPTKPPLRETNVPDLTLVSFDYVNYRGERSRRRVRPIRMWFGSTAYHPHAQWLLEALDLDRQETRDFALADVAGWRRLVDASPVPTDVPTALSILPGDDNAKR